MATRKLSQRAQILLVLVCDCTTRDSAGQITCYWYPNPKGHNWSQTLGGNVYASGGGDASSLNALARAGLIKRESASKYSFSSTEDGVLHFEREIRESGKLDELRQVITKHTTLMNGPADLED